MAGGPAIRIDIENVRETLTAFNRLPKEANVELRKAALELSGDLAAGIRGAAGHQGRQAGILAVTVRPKRDRTPSVTVGGTKRVGRNRTPAHLLLFGSEFGGRGHGFLPYRAGVGGGAGYWIFPTVRATEADASKRWNEAAAAIVRRFSEMTATPGGGA